MADMLSRAPMNTTTRHLTELKDFEVMTVQHISSSRQNELCTHTPEDVSLQVLSNIIRPGWPDRLHSETVLPIPRL